MVTDDELLAAVRSAGEPGSESHRLACRLYRRSVLEWREEHAGLREERELRAAVGRLVALLAESADKFGMLDDACGSHRGYNRHLREKTPVCPRCGPAETEYAQGWYQARKAAAAGQALQEAA